MFGDVQKLRQQLRREHSLMDMDRFTNTFRDSQKERDYQTHILENTRPRTLIFCTLGWCGMLMYNFIRYLTKYDDLEFEEMEHFTVRISLLVASVGCLLWGCIMPVERQHLWRPMHSLFILTNFIAFILNPTIRVSSSFKEVQSDIGLLFPNASVFTPIDASEYKSLYFQKAADMGVAVNTRPKFLETVFAVVIKNLWPRVNHFPVYAVLSSVVLGLGVPLTVLAGMLVNVGAVAATVAVGHVDMSETFIAGQLLFVLSLLMAHKFDQAERMTVITLMQQERVSKELRSQLLTTIKQSSSKSMKSNARSDTIVSKESARHFALPVHSPLEIAITQLSRLANRAKSEYEKQALLDIIGFLWASDADTVESLDLQQLFSMGHEGPGSVVDADVQKFLTQSLNTAPPSTRSSRNILETSVEDWQDSQNNLDVSRKACTPLLSSSSLDSDALKFVGKLDNWDLDMFELRALSEERPLIIVSWAVMQKHDLLKRMNIKPENFIKFIENIESAYLPNPYHNSMHGADVMHAVHYILDTLGYKEILSEQDMFAVLFSAAVHDVGHPGVSNNFLIKSNDPLAITYSDSAVLERMHIATAFRIARTKDECNIFSGFSDELYTEVRKTSIAIILATDLAGHYAFSGRLKSLKSASSMSIFDEHLTFMQTIVKLSDISHSSKTRSVHLQWTEAIVEEFFLQGDREKANDMAISAFMDRSTPNTSKNQIGFFEYIVLPFYEIVVGHLEKLSPIHKAVLENFDFWQQQHNRETKASSMSPIELKVEDDLVEDDVVEDDNNEDRRRTKEIENGERRVEK